MLAFTEQSTGGAPVTCSRHDIIDVMRMGVCVGGGNQQQGSDEHQAAGGGGHQASQADIIRGRITRGRADEGCGGQDTCAPTQPRQRVRGAARAGEP